MQNFNFASGELAESEVLSMIMGGNSPNLRVTVQSNLTAH